LPVTFSPTHGTPGTLVTITASGGPDFAGATSVKLGTLNSWVYFIDSPTQIRAYVPDARDISAAWIITTPTGGWASATNFTVDDYPTGIHIAPNNYRMWDGDDMTLQAILWNPGGAYLDMSHESTVVWSSSDTSIATVGTGTTTGGDVLAHAPGLVTITANWVPLSGPGGTSSAVLLVEPMSGGPSDDGVEGRFHLAFDSTTLEPNPVWTRLDDVFPNLVVRYSIDRGRSYEMDRTDAGRATVEINDTEGILNPLNESSPFWSGDETGVTKIRPLLQALICRRNPVTGEWNTRFRGFVDSYDLEFDSSQVVNRMTISLTDLFSILGKVEMTVGQFGQSTTITDYQGMVYYPGGHTPQQRIRKVLDDVGLPAPFTALLPGNVKLYNGVYSEGETPMTAIQEAADGDFPQVSNVYCDRFGRLAFHGRKAKFFPQETSDDAGDRWVFQEWKVGDGAAIAADPDTVQLRSFGFVRGMDKFINVATASPLFIEDNQLPDQLVVDAWSVGIYGINSWSATNLLTGQSLLDSADALTETRRMATYFVANYKFPHDRLTALSFRALPPSDPRAPILWEFLNTVDVGDRLDVVISSPGGGGYPGPGPPGTRAKWFVEGIHEQVNALNPEYDDVTMTFDLSPAALFETNPWPDP